MTWAIVWPCAGAIASVRKTNRSSVPWSISPLMGLFPRLGMYAAILPLDHLLERDRRWKTRISGKRARLSSGEERRQRQVPHRVQAGRRGQDFRDRVHHDRRGRHIAVDAACDLHREIRRPFDLDRVVGLGRPEVRLHVQLDDRLALPVADAVLDDAADVARVDREKLARDRHRRELRLNVVADPIQRPAERVGNHRDRFGQADVPHAPIVDFLLELLGREACADLLLERQPADARVLHAVDDDAVDALADGGQRDRQRVHREAGIDAGSEHGHFRFLRQRVNRARLPDMRVAGIRQLLRRRDDGRLRLEDRLDLRHHFPDRRAGAKDHDVRLRFLERLRGIARHRDVQPLRQPDDVAEIAVDLRGIDVDGADDLEPGTRGHLLDDRGADRAETEVHNADIWHKLRNYMSDAWAALRDGARRVNGAPAILFGAWALLVAAILQTRVALHVPAGVAVLWVREMLTSATDAPAAVLLHATTAEAVAIACSAILAWLFITGGILDRFARDRAVRSFGFFGVSGACFFRFLRLAA